MKKIILLTILIACSVFAKSAPKTHDGFFLNGTAGFGYGNYLNEFNNEGVKMESKGPQIETGFKIGGAIIPNLILHANINVNTILSSIKASNKNGDEAQTSSNSFKVILFGAGVTYYLPSELNIFLSASAGIADYTEICALGESVSSHDDEFSFNLSAGKEWWINNEFGIGIALSYNHTSAKSEFLKVKGEASSNSISVVATFTFN